MKRFAIALMANLFNQLDCKNGLCSWWIQVRYFLLNQHIQIFQYGSILMNKIMWDMSMWMYITENEICQSLLVDRFTDKKNVFKCNFIIKFQDVFWREK